MQENRTSISYSEIRENTRENTREKLLLLNSHTIPFRKVHISPTPNGSQNSDQKAQLTFHKHLVGCLICPGS